MRSFDRLGRLAAAALLGAAVLAPAQAQPSPMSPAEIQQAWVGKKVFARSARGALMDFFLRADGTASVSGTNFADTGRWRLSDNGYCVTWTRIRAGEEGCFTVVRDGATTRVLNADQSPNAEILRVVE